MTSTPSDKPGTGYPVIYRNLMSVGLLGEIYRVGEDAKTINAAVERTLSDPGCFSSYLAVAMAMGGSTEYASSVLGSRVEEHPQDDEAKLAMAVSLLFGGDTSWRHWVNNVLATSGEPRVREAALGILSYVTDNSSTH